MMEDSIIQKMAPTRSRASSRIIANGNPKYQGINLPTTRWRMKPWRMKVRMSTMRFGIRCLGGRRQSRHILIVRNSADLCRLDWEILYLPSCRFYSSFVDRFVYLNVRNFYNFAAYIHKLWEPRTMRSWLVFHASWHKWSCSGQIKHFHLNKNTW